MRELLIEPHYLGSLEYYSLLSSFDSVRLEVNELFQKQTFRNRCYFLGSSGVHPLIIPVSYDRQTILKEVKIDHQQRWKKDHWGAFYSFYGKAPFFEYFAEDFQTIWNRRHLFLVDICLDFLELSFRLLDSDVKMTLYEPPSTFKSVDFKDVIIPKKPFTDRKIYHPSAYTQVFSDNFIPNLSIVDLIMCEGPRAREILTASFLSTDA